MGRLHDSTSMVSGSLGQVLPTVEDFGAHVLGLSYYL